MVAELTSSSRTASAAERMHAPRSTPNAASIATSSAVPLSSSAAINRRTATPNHAAAVDVHRLICLRCTRALRSAPLSQLAGQQAEQDGVATAVFERHVRAQEAFA